MITRPVHRRQWLAAGATLALCGTIAVAVARASDHQDTPVRRAESEDRPDRRLRVSRRLGPHRARHGHPRLSHAGAERPIPSRRRSTPTSSTSSRSTPMATPSRTRSSRSRSAAKGRASRSTCAVPSPRPSRARWATRWRTPRPALSGAIGTVLGSGSGMQVFAGPRDDPFFIDLEAAFCILPDRRPVGGQLSGSCALTPSQPGTPFYFRNPGVNYVERLQRQFDRDRAARRR